MKKRYCPRHTCSSGSEANFLFQMDYYLFSSAVLCSNDMKFEKLIPLELFSVFFSTTEIFRLHCFWEQSMHGIELILFEPIRVERFLYKYAWAEFSSRHLFVHITNLFNRITEPQNARFFCHRIEDKNKFFRIFRVWLKPDCWYSDIRVQPNLRYYLSLQ